MDSSYMETQYHHQTQQPGTTSGLLRYRSAPTSLFDDVAQDLFTQNGYSGSGSGLGSGGLPPQYPKPTMVSPSLIKRDVDESTKPTMVSTSSCGGLNLNRQSSSPAGFFTSLNTQNEYTMMRSIGNFRGGNGTNGESTSKLSMRHLPQIPEIGVENVKETNPKGMNFRNHDDHPGFDKSTRFSFSWNETSSEASHPSENGGLTTRPNVLMHHLSLPKTSSEMAAVEKLLHFQDTVPWKIRAKRGCATHPRSIAERMRRNRISERMRKLQDLVPNMDKQTNTADMLDFAVEYIKNLQDQYKALSDIRARCKCVNLKHSVTNHAT